MLLRLEEAMCLLNLSGDSIPRTQDEEKLLLELVDSWKYTRGEAWVRNNFLLWYEWEERRRVLNQTQEIE